MPQGGHVGTLRALNTDGDAFHPGEIRLKKNLTELP
jgi:hypothetical protein